MTMNGGAVVLGGGMTISDTAALNGQAGQPIGDNSSRISQGLDGSRTCPFVC